MNMHLVSRIGIAISCIAALGAAAVTLTPARAETSATPLSIHERVLRSNELPRFASLTCPLPITDAKRWADGYLSVDLLRRNGFVAGLKEDLHSSTTGADALSVVAQFRTAQGARDQVQAEIASARETAGTYTSFPVPGIPGARGFTLGDGVARGHNVVFSDGPFQYLVGIGFPVGAEDAVTRAQVIAAATALYRRVHGHSAP